MSGTSSGTAKDGGGDVSRIKIRRQILSDNGELPERNAAGVAPLLSYWPSF